MRLSARPARTAARAPAHPSTSACTSTPTAHRRQVTAPGTSDPPLLLLPLLPPPPLPPSVPSPRGPGPTLHGEKGDPSGPGPDRPHEHHLPFASPPRRA